MNELNAEDLLLTAISIAEEGGADMKGDIRKVIELASGRTDEPVPSVKPSPFRNRKNLVERSFAVKSLMTEQEKEELKRLRRAVTDAVEAMWDAWGNAPDHVTLFDRRLADFHRKINSAHNELKGHYNTVAERQRVCDQIGNDARQLASALSMQQPDPNDAADHRQTVDALRGVAAACIRITRTLTELARHPRAK